MRRVDCEQGDARWLEVRTGKVTASRVHDVIATLKRGGYTAERAKYLTELVVERLTGYAASHFVTPAMAFGSAMEPEARAAYEFMHDATVELVGFVLHPTIDDSGASPDGLVGEDGSVEFKCPTSATHIETLQTRTVADEYQAQIQWVLACTDRAWCDFVSYDPRMPAALRICEIRVRRDEKTIAAMAVAVAAFLGEVQDKVDALLKLGANGPPAVEPPPGPRLVSAAPTADVDRKSLIESIRATLAHRWPGASKAAKDARAEACASCFGFSDERMVPNLSLEDLAAGRERLRELASS